MVVERYDHRMTHAITAVMDVLGVARAAFIGWSDGADTALVLSRETPGRSAGVFFFGCNVDSTGAKPFQPSAVIDRIYSHHVKEYAALSPVEGGFEAMPNTSPAVSRGRGSFCCLTLVISLRCNGRRLLIVRCWGFWGRSYHPRIASSLRTNWHEHFQDDAGCSASAGSSHRHSFGMPPHDVRRGSCQSRTR